MLSEEKAMEILEAYDLTSSFRSAAALCGVDHHTVRRYVAARAAGLDPATAFGRPTITDPFADKIAEWVERSCGAVRADVVHRKLMAMGFVGSERTTRRVVARLKREYVRSTHRIYKPWVTEPGMWLQFDYGKGPVVGRSARPRCSVPGWPGPASGWSSPSPTGPSRPWSRRLDRTLRMMGGAPTYLLTDNEKTVTTRHVAGLAVRNRETLGVAHYYGVGIHTCVVADPESKGGSESSVQAGQGRRAAPAGQPGGRLSRLRRPSSGPVRRRPCASTPGCTERPASVRSIGWWPSRAELHAIPRRALLGGPGRDPDGVVVLAHLLSRGRATRCPINSARRWSSSDGMATRWSSPPPTSTGPRRWPVTGWPARARSPWSTSTIPSDRRDPERAPKASNHIRGELPGHRRGGQALPGRDGRHR